MTKRFKVLDKALKYCRVGTGTSAVSTPPAGSPLEQFQKYKDGAIQPDYAQFRSDSSNPGEISRTTIAPFGYPPAQSTRFKVPFSNRTKTRQSVASLLTACNLDSTQTILDAAQEVTGFIPAKATIFIPTSSTTTRTSELTGIQYERIGGESYTFPYGRSSSTEYESEVRAAVAIAAQAINDKYTVSYSPEKI